MNRKIDASVLALVAEAMLRPQGDEGPATWSLHLPGKTANVHRVLNARVEYIPNPDRPTHVVVWSDCVCLVVDYHMVDALVRNGS